MTKFSKYVIYFLLAIIAITVFYLYVNSGRNLDLDLKAPAEALIGVPFDLKVEFGNQSGSVLNDVLLTVNLPEGAVFAGKDKGKLLENKELGNVGEGSLITETYRVVFLSGKDSTKKFRATINYSPTTLGARFEKTKELGIIVQNAGVAVEMNGPEQVFGGEEFDLEIIYQNVSETDFTDLELKLEYPPNFSFLSSTVKPDKGKDTWLLGDLRQGSEGTFIIRGSVIGPEESVVEFKPVLKTTLAGKSYDLEIQPFSLTIAPSPLSLAITLNGQPDYISKLNDNLEYVISYVNDTDTALRKVIIRAQLIGEVFDFNYLNTDAFFSSSDNTLIWNSQNTPNLNMLSSNSAGFVKFGIKTKNTFPIRRFSDKNFVLKVDAEIESPTIETFNVAKLETKISGNIIVGAEGYFRDAQAGILNKGLMPPRVGQPTNFTIHWLLKNFAADASKVEVRAVLEEGVKFTGIAKSNFGEAPFYDEGSNQMVWQIDNLSANQGVVDQPLEAIFQIEAVPLSHQVGKYMPLLGQTFVKAYDDWTGLGIADLSAPISTALPQDTTINVQSGVVQP